MLFTRNAEADGKNHGLPSMSRRSSRRSSLPFFETKSQKPCFSIGSICIQKLEVFTLHHVRMTQTYSDHIGPWDCQTTLPRRVLLRDCSLSRPEGAFCQKKSLSRAERSPSRIPLGSKDPDHCHFDTFLYRFSGLNQGTHCVKIYRTCGFVYEKRR